MLARPLLENLSDVPEPFILDFATGTGRLSYALLNRPEFHGQIVAIDLSQGMLEQAAAKLNRARVDLLRHASMPLPFPDAAFDAVCCLEVLELLPDAQAALREMSRLLRSGGVLLTSRGTEESGRKAKVKSEAEMTSMLQANGFEQIRINRWWKLFDRVLARKRGDSPPVRTRSLMDVLKCPSCGQTAWDLTDKTLQCSTCGHVLVVTHRGIVLN
jgi:SAM-dependent methyltransferase